jgi:hypothetical protein
MLLRVTETALSLLTLAPPYHHPPDRISLLKVDTLRNFGRKLMADGYKSLRFVERGRLRFVERGRLRFVERGRLKFVERGRLRFVERGRFILSSPGFMTPFSLLGCY